MSRWNTGSALLLLVGLALDRPIAAAQGTNYWIAFPLHAVIGTGQPCELGEGITCYCSGYHFPNSVVPANTEITVFVSMWNFCGDIGLMGIQTAFEWDKSWTLLGSAWDCRSNQLVATIPEDPGGSTAGTITTAFDCVQGGYAVNIGRLFFRTGSSGCLSQVQSTYPFGIHGLDCNQGINQIGFTHPIDYYRLGSICVESQPPRDGCIDPGPVEAATWGRIKAAYHDGN